MKQISLNLFVPFLPALLPFAYRSSLPYCSLPAWVTGCLQPYSLPLTTSQLIMELSCQARCWAGLRLPAWDRAAGPGAGLGSSCQPGIELLSCHLRWHLRCWAGWIGLLAEASDLGCRAFLLCMHGQQGSPPGNNVDLGFFLKLPSIPRLLVATWTHPCGFIANNSE